MSLIPDSLIPTRGNHDINTSFDLKPNDANIFFFLYSPAYVFFTHILLADSSKPELYHHKEDLNIPISLPPSFSAGREIPLPPRSTSWRSSSVSWPCSAGPHPMRSHGLHPERSRVEQETTLTYFLPNPKNRVDEAKSICVTQNKRNKRKKQQQCFHTVYPEKWQA